MILFWKSSKLTLEGKKYGKEIFKPKAGSFDLLSTAELHADSINDQ